MNKIITWIIGAVAVLALVLSIGNSVGGNNQPVSKNLGGMTNLDGLTITPALPTDGFKVGSNGSTNSEMISGTCTSFTASTLATGDGVAQAASTTKAYDCAVTGVTSGDVVLAQFGTSTPITTTAGSNYWAIIGAKASTTAGFISLLIYNNGPSAVPSALGVGSSTNYWIVDTI